MQVGISYSEPAQQVWLTLEVADNADVRTVIHTSGILQMFPHIDLVAQKVGIFGRVTRLDATLNPGDRVEIYRPLVCDPAKVARRDEPLMQDD